MAVTVKIFILCLGVVIVKSHHLHHMNNRHQDNHHPNFIDNIFHMFGSGLFGNRDPQSSGSVGVFNNYDNMGQEGNYAPSNTGMDYQDYGQYDDNNAGVNLPDQSNVYIPDQSNVNIGLTNEPQSPDVNLNIAVPNGPQTPDVNLNIAVPNEPQSPDVHFSIAVPNRPQTPDVNLNIAVPNEPQSPDVHFNIAVPNSPQTPDIHFNIAVPNEPQSPDVHFNIAVPNSPQTPDIHFNIAVPNEPLTSEVQGLNSPANKGSVNIVNVNAPENTNGQSDETQREPNFLDKHVDINQSQTNRVPDNVEIPNINADAGLKTASGYVNSSGSSPQNNPGEANGNLIAKNVPGFTDDDIKKGIVMVDPELKYNNNVAHKAKISGEVQGQVSDVEAGFFAPAVVGLNLQNEKVDKKDDSIGNKGQVSGFNNDDIKKDMLMVDPELKYNTNENYEIQVPDFNVAEESIDNNDENEKPNDLFENKNKIPGLTGDSITMTSPDEPKLSHNIGELQPQKIIEQHDDEKAVPGFNDDDFKKGIMMNDPVLKNNETDVGLDKYSDAVVFPDNVDEAKKQNQFNTDDKQNLPNRFSAGDSNKENASIIAPVVALTSLSASDYGPSPWTTNNNGQTIPTSNNQGTQHQYTKPNSVEFAQSLNQQVPVNNGNGSPYVNVVRNPNGEYSVVNIPNNNNGQNPSHVYVSGSSAVNNPGQSYASGDSGVNNPGQSYLLVNSGLNNLGQNYVSGSPGLKGPGQAYIPVNVNSGVTNPGQTYIITDGGNSQAKNPSQIYVSGINNQGQIYVPANAGTNNPGQMYVSSNVPSSGSQITSGGYYNVIQLSNGQTVLVPVNGNGQNVQWDGQSNNGQMYVPVNYSPGHGYQTLGSNPTGNVVNLGNSGNVVTIRPTNNVPLLISYKDKDDENEEKSAELNHDQRKEEKEE